MIPFPPRRILVSYDFSSECRDAWSYARGLAQRLGSAVEAIHVREWLDPAGALLRGVLPPATRRRLEDAMAVEIPGVAPAGYHVVEGRASTGIVALARRRRAGLIVLAAEGLSENRRFAPGCAAEAVIRAAKVPVLVLHERAASVRSVLLPLGPIPISRAAFSLATRCAAALGARLTPLDRLERLTAHDLVVLPLEKSVGKAAWEILRRSRAPVLTLPA